MKKLKATFRRGVVGDSYKTKDNFPQIAFFGRSNSGKSSVINSLVGEKNLVRVSKTPGETKEANFYLVNNAFYFVDFPGYGYAKCSLKMRNRMIKRIFWYIEEADVKPNAIFLITDIKVGLTDLDREMIEKLRQNNHQICIIGNKIDKLKKLAREKQLTAVKNEVDDIPVLLYSAKTKEGIEEFIEKILHFCASPGDAQSDNTF